MLVDLVLLEEWDTHQTCSASKSLSSSRSSRIRMLHLELIYSSPKSEVPHERQSKHNHMHSMITLQLLTCPSYDYTKGKLDELVDIIIDSGAKLFVSAVGVPPKH